MSNTCPDCGDSIEFTEQAVRLRRGSCGACHHEFTFVEGAALSVPPGASAELPKGEAPEAPEGTPECADCGGPLAFRALSDGSIEARCDACDSTAVYVSKEEAGEEERPARAPRGRGPEEREFPRSRPCRQCGAPLRFTTNEEGSLVGECESCGNRFTLPPRSDFGRGGGGRFGRGGRPGGGGFRSPRSGGSWGRGPSRGGRPRKYGESRNGSGDQDERRRRRRRSED